MQPLNWPNRRRTSRVDRLDCAARAQLYTRRRRCDMATERQQRVVDVRRGSSTGKPRRAITGAPQVCAKLDPAGRSGQRAARALWCR